MRKRKHPAPTKAGWQARDRVQVMSCGVEAKRSRHGANCTASIGRCSRLRLHFPRNGGSAFRKTYGALS